MLFQCLVKIKETKEHVRFDCERRKNGTKIIDENINIIMYSLTVLGKTNKEISVKIKNQSVFVIDS